MALFDTNSNNTNTNTNTGTTTDRPKAQLWLNVGVPLEVTQEDGTVITEFMSLPVGIPLDTTEPMVARGNNKDWHKKVAVKNALLKMAQETAEALEAGEGAIIDKLQIQVFRSNDPTAAETPATENELLGQLGDIMNAA